MVRTHWAGRWARTWLMNLLLAGPGTLAVAPAWADDEPALTPAAAPADAAPATDEARPAPLRRPTEPAPEPPTPVAPTTEPAELLRTRMDPPLGFSGPSGIAPREAQTSSHFVPVEDRWRLGFPYWDRYGKDHRLLPLSYAKDPANAIDYPFEEGNILNPYRQNMLKGDYPICGQHTFLNVTALTTAFFEGRQVPTATTPFESTQRPFEEEFFGRPNQYFYNQIFALNLELSHGDAAFKQPDWALVLTPTFNINLLDVNELGVINPNVLKGTTRSRTYSALEQYFLEVRLADTSPDYDFVSARVGSQPFTSDFRGFLFSDTNRAVRIFGTAEANRDQFNFLYFRMQEKDTNSGLNTFNDRGQDILIANFFRQDFIWPGYTALWSIHYNHDPARLKFDKNDFLVRPDADGITRTSPGGIANTHELNVAYLGWGGDGHINRFNITHQYYLALGRDSNNPLANQAVDIMAHFAAVELSYDRDWARFRTSFLWSSGDHDINNAHASGFDSIQDNPNFAGGRFSYWQRQAIGLFSVNLVQRESLIPDLRSSKIQGQSNFVNPGLFLFNVGFDADITPTLKMINNVNFLWFDDTAVLEQFAFQHNIDRSIGTDISTGFEYRPLASNNIIMTFGVSTLIPGTGFKQLYNQLRDNVDPLFAGFLEITLAY